MTDSTYLRSIDLSFDNNQNLRMASSDAYLLIDGKFWSQTYTNNLDKSHIPDTIMFFKCHKFLAADLSAKSGDLTSLCLH